VHGVLVYYVAASPQICRRNSPTEWQEKLIWQALGFRVIQYIDICCVRDGVFRRAIESELALDEYACPQCQCPCSARRIAEGVTKYPEQDWVLVEPPMWKKMRLWLEQLLDDEQIRPRKPLRRPPGRPRKQDRLALAERPLWR
jgi:hypothetical protein